MTAFMQICVISGIFTVLRCGEEMIYSERETKKLQGLHVLIHAGSQLGRKVVGGFSSLVRR